MNNTEYIEKILSSVDRILVDTSTLMTHGFQQFICNNKERILAAGKKIIVPKAVYSELARHMDSADSTKSSHAMAAVELMALNKDIFQVESVPLTEDEIAHAFADAQLLSELTLHHSECRQLLITNDRKLSCDAFDLNLQQSCKGRRVLVCYINCYGQLQCCECARSSSERIVHELLNDTPSNDTEPMDSTITGNETVTTPNIWNFDGLSSLISIFGFGLLYILHKNRKNFL